jgi:hypothetical protein
VTGRIVEEGYNGRLARRSWAKRNNLSSENRGQRASRARMEGSVGKGKEKWRVGEKKFVRLCVRERVQGARGKKKCTTIKKITREGGCVNGKKANKGAFFRELIKWGREGVASKRRGDGTVLFQKSEECDSARVG